MHHRKSSKEDTDDGDTFVLVPPLDSDDGSTVAPILTAPPNSSRHPIPRAQMESGLPQLSSGLQRLGTGSLLVPQPPARRPPSISLNSPPTSPFHSSHSRVRSISSGPFIPPVSSPLATKFHVPLHPFEPGSSFLDSLESIGETSGAGPGQHARRHSHLHSRNLSIIFPRPHATISEDTVSDVESAPLSPGHLPHSQISQNEPLQMGHDITPSFSFGSSDRGTISKSISAGGGGMTTRRGHHHKHSLSHNFFSFLDPSAQPEIRPEELHTTPTPAPMSPWSPVSNLQGPGGASSAVVDLITGTSTRSNSTSPSPALSSSHYTPSTIYWNLSKDGLVARVVCILQFCLGALIWVRGQAIGSLACTGLGYWVVFDAFGIAVGGPLVGKGKSGFSTARTQTTLLFAQCVYLMFAGVYVAKEAIEHILLSGGHSHSSSHPMSSASAALDGSTGGVIRGLGLHGAGEMGSDGHHHHWGDERPETLGLRYPLGLIILALLSLLATSAAFEQHDVLVRVTNKYIHIPSPLSLLEKSRTSHLFPSQRHGSWGRILRNPYALPPVVFCLAILGGEMALNVSRYTSFDLSLAMLQVVITTHVAYAACVVLGGVLLQTAPVSSFGKGIGKGMNSVARSMSTSLEANMEAFWRVMREIERHEHVVSLPAPHVWQVCPPGQSSFGPGDKSRRRQGYGPSHPALSPSDSMLSPSDSRTISPPPQLIITLSPHVSSSLTDEEVLKLTKWASDRVRGVFVTDSQRGIGGHGVEVEVCVGILRG